MRIAFLVMLAVIVYTSIVYAQKTIKVVAIENMPPYAYREDAQFKGIDYDILMELSQRMGFKVDFYLYPFKRAFEYCRNGSMDAMVHLYYKEEREKLFIYPREPVRQSALYIFVKKENEKEYTGSSIRALYGKKVGKNMWFDVSKEFNKAAKEKKFIIDESCSTRENIIKLLHGRIDCYLSAYHVAMKDIKTMKLQGKIVPLKEPVISSKNIFMIISRKGRNIKDKKTFVKKINDVLRNMHRDGVIKKIEDHYLR